MGRGQPLAPTAASRPTEPPAGGKRGLSPRPSAGAFLPATPTPVRPAPFPPLGILRDCLSPSVPQVSLSFVQPRSLFVPQVPSESELESVLGRLGGAGAGTQLERARG